MKISGFPLMCIQDHTIAHYLSRNNSPVTLLQFHNKRYWWLSHDIVHKLEMKKLEDDTCIYTKVGHLEKRDGTIKTNSTEKYW